ncbi:unnamed protein product [Thlaspi arvense]|uniref:Uncharacterized protein n=1 Tax=Thlaspi arvense TaxID=13288 RepID=A0AAU9SR13_THLAR|nr:unnamed protein product [Thlaspi arvense]
MEKSMRLIRILKGGEKALMRLGYISSILAVFIGRKLMDTTNKVMSLQLIGSVIPLLKPCHQLN